MKKLTTILAVLVSLMMLTFIASCDDGLTTRERHDKEYSENKANMERFEAQCYQGDKRACRIVVYSADQVERYRVTYPEGKQ